jgi:hypothetical protein
VTTSPRRPKVYHDLCDLTTAESSGAPLTQREEKSSEFSQSPATLRLTRWKESSNLAHNSRSAPPPGASDRELSKAHIRGEILACVCLREIRSSRLP